MRAVIALLLGGLSLAACGRSSPDPCRAREGLTCETLAVERALEQDDFDAAVDALDASRASAEGACVQALVTEQVERSCIADPCLELCALHPCSVRDADGAPSDDDCATRCDAEVAEAAIARADLDRAIIRAAESPTLCTCVVCDEATQPLCDALWVCEADLAD